MNAEKPSEALLTKHIVFPFRGTEQERKKKKKRKEGTALVKMASTFLFHLLTRLRLRTDLISGIFFSP